MKATTFIYALQEGGIVRYIGKSSNPQKRINDHISQSVKRLTYKDNWIQSMLARGEPIVLSILQEVPVSEWQEWERLYIEGFRLVFPLTNLTDGGEGIPNMSPEIRAKISAKRKGVIPKYSLEELARRREALSARCKGKPIHPNTSKAVSESNRRRIRSAEERHKISIGNKGKKRSPEAIARYKAIKKSPAQLAALVAGRAKMLANRLQKKNEQAK